MFLPANWFGSVLLAKQVRALAAERDAAERVRDMAHEQLAAALVQASNLIRERDRLAARVEALSLPGHKCEKIADVSNHMMEGRSWWIGRLTEPIEGYPQEKWCLHMTTPLKPEIVFGFNEADWDWLAVLAYCATERHTNPTWIESLAKSAKARALLNPDKET